MGDLEEISDEIVERQEAMAFLRERYLYLISKLSAGTECDVVMFEGTNVKCRVKGFDLDTEDVVVEDLITPRPTPIKKAVLRGSDIISLQFHCDYSELLR